MVLFANELIQSYGGIIVLILVVVIGVLSYQAYRDRHQTKTGKDLTSNVIKVLKKNKCKVKGNQVTCQGAQFAGLGEKFTVSDAVDKVLDMISTEMGGGPPPQIPPNPYPPQRAGPATQAPPMQPPPGAGRPMPRGPPDPLQTNPKRAAMGQGGPVGGPPASGPASGGFGGLMSADGEPLGGSLAGSDAPGGHTVGGMGYSADVF